MGGPYASPAASLGLVPTPRVDIPICAVFILLYLIGFISHITLFRRNLARGHKFIFSGMTGGFCMSRVVTNILRIVWATHQHNVRVIIAANVFVNAGILLLYVVNLVFAIRMLKAAVPSQKLALIINRGAIPFFILLILMLVMLIITAVQSAYSLNGNTHRIDRDIQLAATTYFFVIAFAPLPIVAVANYLFREETYKPFGIGTWNAKLLRIVITAALATFIAGFRMGTSWEPPRLATNPAWYQQKWCLYVFNFAFEIIIVYTLLLSRVDLHFFIGKDAGGDGEMVHPQQYALGTDGNWRAVDDMEEQSLHKGALDRQRIGLAIGSQESLASAKSKP